jgi:Flp pilus assembly pilin Flp
VRDAARLHRAPMRQAPEQGGAAPLNEQHSEESRRGAEDRHQPSARNAFLNAKGGEVVLKLFARARAVAASVDVPRWREDGQTMAEYGVVLTVITIAVVSAIGLLSTSVQNAIENVVGLLPG